MSADRTYDVAVVLSVRADSYREAADQLIAFMQDPEEVVYLIEDPVTGVGVHYPYWLDEVMGPPVKAVLRLGMEVTI